MFIAPKVKYCVTINENGKTEGKNITKGFEDAKRLLGRKQNFD